MGVLIAAYVLICSELLHITVAAIIGSVSMVGTGMWMGFYSQEEALLTIDGNTILSLMVLMMIVDNIPFTVAMNPVILSLAYAVFFDFFS